MMMIIIIIIIIKALAGMTTGHELDDLGTEFMSLWSQEFSPMESRIFSKASRIDKGSTKPNIYI
jgi:hypothetical protein